MPRGVIRVDALSDNGKVKAISIEDLTKGDKEFKLFIASSFIFSKEDESTLRNNFVQRNSALSQCSARHPGDR